MTAMTFSIPQDVNAYKVTVSYARGTGRQQYLIIAKDKYEAASKAHWLFNGSKDGVRITVFGPADEL